MNRYDYNVVVIGGGAAGLVSSYIAATVKAKVALIEKHKMGGECLNTGCVPSKALIRSAKMLSYAARAHEWGFKKTTVEFDFADVMAQVHSTIKAVEPHDSTERYRSLGVDCIKGEAKITSAHTIEVNGKEITTRSIIVATGSSPLIPSIPGVESVDYLTSDSIWDLKELPARVLVLGGGPIGVEMAQAFSRLGAKVTVVGRAAHLLKKEDVEVGALLSNRFKEEGIEVLTNHTAKSFKGHTLICESEGKEVSIEFDRVIVAIGRKANVAGFGLEELGVAIRSGGTITANPFMQTNVKSIYVCGDVTGPYQFTHTAAHQAWYACLNALFSPFKRFKADYSVIPWATFTDPEVARVGINEKEANANNVPYEVTTYGIDDLDRAITDGEADGFVKVLTVPGKDKILGVTIVAANAGDLITEFILAMKHGIGLNKILGTIHIYPTMAEANKYAAGEWKRAHVPHSAMKLLEKFHTWRR